MTAFVFPNLNRQHSLECTKLTVSMLKSLGFTVYLPVDFKDALKDINCNFSDCENGIMNADYVITIGGDGTILRIATLAAKYSKKLLGINCGRLGFMASLEKEELSKLENLIIGDYNTESRMLLECEIHKSNGESIVLTALNDIAITHGFSYNINDFTVTANGTVVSSLRADGLIFSTPTGATAYSLSAGGPLIDPTIDCIEFTQICPHSLSARTMIFSPDKILEVTFTAQGSVGICADGHSPIEITSDDKIRIKRSKLKLELIDIQKNNYYYSISKKLMNSTKE